MKYLKKLFVFLFFLISFSVFAGTTAFTDGSDQGFYVVRVRDTATGNVLSARIASPSGETIVSTGEEVLIGGNNYFVSDIWNVGISGQGRLLKQDNVVLLSGDTNEALHIAFGGCASRDVSDEWGNRWKETVCGIFLKTFWEEMTSEKKLVLKQKIELLFQNGGVVQHDPQNLSGTYPVQQAFEVYNPKLIDIRSEYPKGGLAHVVVLAFNAICRGGADGRIENDLGQCLVVLPLMPINGSVVDPFVVVSERTLCGQTPSGFEKMSWNWNLGYDGADRVILNVFSPKCIIGVDVLRMYDNPTNIPWIRFEDVPTPVPGS